MPLSLHAATIPSMLQILEAGHGWFDKAAAAGMSEEDLCGSSLIQDMLPLAYQVKSMAVHSMGAIEGVRAGIFAPDMTEPPKTVEGLKDKLDAAKTFLAGVTEEEMEGFIGQPMRFEIAAINKRLDFTADEFLLSFSQPNFYFHATTAYDILRHKGVPVGKLDYLGKLRTV